MSSDEPRRGLSVDLKPHAYDPLGQPEFFESVVSRRVIAFIVDFIILAIPVVFLAMFIFVAGVITLGLGFFLYLLLWPAAVIWALVYYGTTLGGPHSATVGMRVMDLEMRLWYGAPMYGLLGAVHPVVFWISVSVLTPLVLLAPFFNHRRRCLHDFLCGTVVVNNEDRAEALRPRRPPPAPSPV